MKKILTLDIETMPAHSLHFDTWKTDITMEKMIEPSCIYSVGMKWLGDRECMYFCAPMQIGQKFMLEEAHNQMKQADAIITYNGDKFDLPRLRGEFAEAGLRPLTITSIDMIKTIKTLKLPYNSLAYALQYFDLGQKVKTGGFELWRDVWYGNEKAEEKMKRYCLGDVRKLEKLYLRLRPYIKNHPDLSDGTGCPVCLSTICTPENPRLTKLYTIERNRCECSYVYDGKRKRTRRESAP